MFEKTYNIKIEIIDETLMLMPKLQPLPIMTQKYNLLVKIWKLIVSKRQWQVIEDWQYRLPNKRLIIIPAGFTFDGSSYPRVIWLFFSTTGILIIPLIIHEFCFKYNYLWAIQDDKLFKFKKNYGFFNWCKLIRQIGIERNQLKAIDYLIWGISLTFGWINWLAFKYGKFEEIRPKHTSKNKKDSKSDK